MQEETPLRDVFATQGMLAVLILILVMLLHIFAPEYCRTLLLHWKQIIFDSADIPELLRTLLIQVREWFAFLFGG